MKQLWCLYLLLAALPANAQWRKFSFQQPKMGSMFNLVIYATDSAAAARAAAAAYRQIDTLNLVYSDYLPESELNRLCAEAGNGQWIKVSEPLYSIISAALAASKRSKGSFDITAGPLTRLWREARKTGSLPSETDIRQARSRTGYRYIKMNPKSNAIQLTKKGMQLDLGGIAKGETSQRVITRLEQQGFAYALIDAGGDIVCSGTPPGADAWRIAINNPQSESVMSLPLLLRHGAVTTSGDLYQFLYLAGRRYSHIINPLNGRALTNSPNVTVIAKTGILADWLTKACSILPIPEALKLVSRFPDTEVQIATLKNNKPVFHRSPGFHHYFDGPPNVAR